MSQADQGQLQGLMRQAGAALQRGDAPAALALLGQAEPHAPELPEIHLNKALAYRLLGDTAGGLAAFDSVLAREPRHFVALLSKAALIEQASGLRHAARPYRAALAAAPDEAALPPALRAALNHARQVIEADAAALHAHLRAHTRALRAQFGQSRLDRFDESLDIFAGAARVFTNKPLLLHYPALAPIAFYDRDLFPWLPELEAATETIAAELRGLLAHAAAEFAPYIQYPKGVAVNQWGELNHSRRWSSYFLWRNGVRHDEACHRCPHTAALIDRLPLMHQADFAPTAVFSALEPHTHIPPHTGSTNTRLLVHLPLILPGPARFRVGNHVRDWTLGEAWVFDDTIEHEAWNDADAMRVILILDVWNPSLSQAERALVAAMMAAKNSYYAET